MNFPYYIITAVERYKRVSPDSKEADRLARLISVNIGDPESLKSILLPRHLATPNFLTDPSSSITQDEPPTSASSMDTIDTFLDKFSPNIPIAGYLATAELDSPLPSAESKPFEENAAKEENKQKKQKSGEESRLKRLMSEKRYEEAMELIEQQNLNNPQKSIYFAHQMRFIKKLIALEKYKNKTNG